MKILNLFAGIGGNRKNWEGEITSVEYKEELARVYKINFPNDNVIVQDVYKFLNYANLNHYDFIWASPSCISHSRARNGKQNTKKLVPDLTGIYGLRIFFQKYYTGKWVIENVEPDYEYPINPSFKLGRHVFWANFTLFEKTFEKRYEKEYTKLTYKELLELHGFNPFKLDTLRKDQVMSNCVPGNIGKYILDQAFKKNKLLELITN